LPYPPSSHPSKKRLPLATMIFSFL
jgi:hypothetical protein